LLYDEEVDKLPPPEWLIEGILPADGLAVLYGPPAIGKSFLALDWAFSVQLGHAWLGHQVKRGTVVYVYGEGGAALGQRKDAWKVAHQVQGRVGVGFLPHAVNLL